jgi:hypothetical protein
MEVQKDHVRLEGGHKFKSLDAGAGASDVITQLGEKDFEQVGDLGVSSTTRMRAMEAAEATAASARRRRARRSPTPPPVPLPSSPARIALLDDDRDAGRWGAGRDGVRTTRKLCTHNLGPSPAPGRQVRARSSWPGARSGDRLRFEARLKGR